MKRIIVIALIYTLNLYPNYINNKISPQAFSVNVPENIVEEFCQPTLIAQLKKNEIVIVQEENKSYRFGIFKSIISPGTFLEIQMDDYIKIIHKDKIKQLSPFWHTLLQPCPSADFFAQLVQQYNQLKPIAASPFVDIKTIDPESKVIVIGDLHGNFKALSRILKNLLQQKIIDKDLKLF